MKRNQNHTLLNIIAVLVLCIPATGCFATVEPELTTAIRHRNVQQARTLLSEGANVNERDEGVERTPLMWAAQTGSLSMVQDLLNHGAAINLKDDDGETALTLARKRGYTKIAQLLIGRGARTTAHAVARRRTV